MADERPPEPEHPSEAPQPDAAARRVSPWAIPDGFSGLVEQRIQQAIREGQFDNLPGAGKPQILDDDDNVPDELRMAFRLMKAQNLKPPWVDLRAEYERERLAYRVWRNQLAARWPIMTAERQARQLDELRLRVAALNDLIHSINAMVPSDQLRLGLLVLAHEQGQVTSG